MRLPGMLIAFTLCTTLTAPSLFAQAVRSYGLKAGAASASQSFDYTIPFSFSPDRRWGIDAGAFVEFLNVPTASILAEVHYIQKGFSEEFNVTSPESPDIIGTTTIRPRLDYLSIPALLKLRLDNESFVPYFMAGPRVDILIGRFDEELSTIDYNSVDFGVTAGVGAEIPVGPANALLLEFRYGPTLTNSFEGEFVNIQNSSMEILLGITL